MRQPSFPAFPSRSHAPAVPRPHSLPVPMRQPSPARIPFPFPCASRPPPASLSRKRAGRATPCLPWQAPFRPAGKRTPQRPGTRTPPGVLRKAPQGPATPPPPSAGAIAPAARPRRQLPADNRPPARSGRRYTVPPNGAVPFPPPPGRLAGRTEGPRNRASDRKHHTPCRPSAARNRAGHSRHHSPCRRIPCRAIARHHSGGTTTPRRPDRAGGTNSPGTTRRAAVSGAAVPAGHRRRPPPPARPAMPCRPSAAPCRAGTAPADTVPPIGGTTPCRAGTVSPVGGTIPPGGPMPALRRAAPRSRPCLSTGGHIDAGNCWRPRPGAPACLPLQARCSASGCRRDAHPKPRGHCSGTSPYLPPAHTLPIKPLTCSDLLPHGLAHSVHYWWGGEGNDHLGRQPAPFPPDRRPPSRPATCAGSTGSLTPTVRKALEYKKRSRYAR